MSTFKLQDSSIEVTLTPDLKKEELLEFPAFNVHISPLLPLCLAHFPFLHPSFTQAMLTPSTQNWISTLRHNLSLQTQSGHEFNSSPYELKSIKIQSIDKFSSSQIGFIKLKAEIQNKDDESLPGSVFLRGPSVGMLIILQPDDLPQDSKLEKHVILTVQPRIPAGTLRLAELPAGMVDDDTFSGSAAKEIKEELGLEIPESELTNLSELAVPTSAEGEGAEKLPQAMFPSAGGCDEYIPIFLHEKRIKRETLKEWTGKLTGLREHGERITLKLVKLDDLWKEGGRDSKALAAYAMYEGLKREGKL